MADPISRVINAPLRTRQGLAFALLVAAVAGVGCLLWIAVASIADLQLEIGEKRETAGRLQAIAALKPGLVENGSDAMPADSSDFLEGESEAVVRGNMQTYLNAIIAAQKADLLSVSNIPELDVDGARYVGIRADFSGTVEAVHNAIFAIETSKPMIIRNASLWLSGADQGVGATQAPQISAQIRIYGALRPDLETPEAKATP